MGNKPLRTLQDVVRAGQHLEITCPNCGRVCVYAALTFLMFLKENAAAVSLGELESRLRCLEGGISAGCGHKGAKVKVIHWLPRGLTLERPEPVHETPPIGVDAQAWAKADARERKRLAQRARG